MLDGLQLLEQLRAGFDIPKMYSWRGASKGDGLAIWRQGHRIAPRTVRFECWRSLPVGRSQCLTLPSPLAASSDFPSGRNARLRMNDHIPNLVGLPLNRLCSAPVDGSEMTIQSSSAQAIFLQSAENAILYVFPRILRIDLTNFFPGGRVYK